MKKKIIFIIRNNFKHLKIHVLLAALVVATVTATATTTATTMTTSTVTATATATATAMATHLKIQFCFKLELSCSAYEYVYSCFLNKQYNFTLSLPDSDRYKKFSISSFNNILCKQG